MLSSVPHPEILFVGAGSAVFSRTAAAGAVTLDANYTGGNVTSLIMDYLNWQDLVVTDSGRVFLSGDGGASFTNITDSLTGTNLHTSAVLHLSGGQFLNGDLATMGQDLILVGGDNGVYYTSETSPAAWTKLDPSTLPNAPVYDLKFDSVDGILAASTLGRGAFELNVVPEPATFALLAAGCLGILGFWRHRRRG
jgi:hypothetical protein